ncbi:hypothetical protein DL765_005010 [Monosporascus sp. GIB2]|nr:hypothetical protein DL765_005010 [Monosporascus sp. GIB2]
MLPPVSSTLLPPKGSLAKPEKGGPEKGGEEYDKHYTNDAPVEAGSRRGTTTGNITVVHTATEAIPRISMDSPRDFRGDTRTRAKRIPRRKTGARAAAVARGHAPSQDYSLNDDETSAATRIAGGFGQDFPITKPEARTRVDRTLMRRMAVAKTTPPAGLRPQGRRRARRRCDRENRRWSWWTSCHNSCLRRRVIGTSPLASFLIAPDLLKQPQAPKARGMRPKKYYILVKVKGFLRFCPQHRARHGYNFPVRASLLYQDGVIQRWSKNVYKGFKDFREFKEFEGRVRQPTPAASFRDRRSRSRDPELYQMQ